MMKFKSTRSAAHSSSKYDYSNVAESVAIVAFHGSRDRDDPSANHFSVTKLTVWFDYVWGVTSCATGGRLDSKEQELSEDGETAKMKINNLKCLRGGIVWRKPAG